MNPKGIPKQNLIDEVPNHINVKKKNQENKDFVSKGENVIDVQSVPEAKLEPERSLKDMMDELDSSFNKKLEQNLKEKDINKIQSNIFKKEKVIKDKNNVKNNNAENKTQIKTSLKSSNRNIKF